MSKTPRPKASDFDPEALRLFDQYVHGVIDRRGFLAGAARSGDGRRRRERAVGRIESALRGGATGGARRCTFVGEVRRVRFAERLRQGARLSGQAGQGPRQVAAGAGGAREPRPQSAHRGHRAPAGAGRFHRLRARRAVSARRLSGRRGRGAHAVRQARPRQDARGFPRRRGHAAQHRGRQRTHGRGRLLLRRRHGQLPRHAPARTSRPRRRSTATPRRCRTYRRSRPNCWSCWPKTTNASTRNGRRTRRR